jgi:NitT/TauT family transport system substrate-binding protein
MRLFKVAGVFLCAALLAQQSAVAQSAKPDASKSLAITVNSWVGWGPLFIAQKKGFFGNTTVDLKFIEDAGARRLAMIAGEADAYGSSVDNLAIDATFGVTGKTVLAFDESAGADGIVAKSDVTWENIKGRTVAVQQGLPGHFLLLSVLKQHKLGPNDVKILDLDADKAGGAFVAGSVDVAVTWEPWISKAAAMSNGKKLITTEGMPGLIVDTLVVRDAVMASKEPAIKAVVSGWFQALDWYAQNPKEGDDIIGAAYNLKPEEVRDIVSGIKFYDKKRNVEYFGSTANPGQMYEVFRNASQLWKDAGITKTTVDPKQYVDPRFVQ